MIGVTLGNGETMMRALMVCYILKISKSWISFYLKFIPNGCVWIFIMVEVGKWGMLELANGKV